MLPFLRGTSLIAACWWPSPAAPPSARHAPEEDEVGLATFDVRTADSTPLPHATLRLRRPGTNRVEHELAWSAAATTFELPAGHWQVEAAHYDLTWTGSHADVPLLSSARQLVTITPGEAGPFRLSLTGRTELLGTVIGWPATDGELIVDARRLAEGEEPETELPRPDRRRGAHDPRRHNASLTRDGESIKFQQPLGRGRWHVAVREQEQRRFLASAVVQLHDRRVVVDFDLRSIDREKLSFERDLTIRVLAPDSSPIRGCSFELQALESSIPPPLHSIASPRRGIEWKELPDGGYRIARARLPRRARLLALHPRFGMTAQEFSVEEIALGGAVELPFAAPAIVTLELAGHAEAVAHHDFEVGFWESVALPGEEELMSLRRLTSAAIGGDGRIAIGCVQPGRATAWLSIAAPAGEHGRPVVAAGAFELRTGEQRLVLACPTLVDVDVRGVPRQDGPFRCAPERVEPGMTDRPSLLERLVTADESGVLRLRDLPTGRWSIFTSAGDQGMRFDAVAGRTAEFVPAPLAAQRVVIVDPERAASSGSLASGDRIIAVDGDEFDSPSAFLKLCQALRRERVTVMVERDATLREVVVSTASLRDPARHGLLLSAWPR